MFKNKMFSATSQFIIFLWFELLMASDKREDSDVVRVGSGLPGRRDRCGKRRTVVGSGGRGAFG
ncbi:hypothetical protein HanPSC8_Chr14g0626821 [Helianthus annuus]|nr:hypothetical protein HanPSC8_Chr14g0626821 [Helianthus annuus]